MKRKHGICHNMGSSLRFSSQVANLGKDKYKISGKSHHIQAKKKLKTNSVLRVGMEPESPEELQVFLLLNKDEKTWHTSQWLCLSGVINIFH